MHLNSIKRYFLATNILTLILLLAILYLMGSIIKFIMEVTMKILLTFLYLIGGAMRFTMGGIMAILLAFLYLVGGVIGIIIEVITEIFYIIQKKFKLKERHAAPLVLLAILFIGFLFSAFMDLR